MLLQLFFIFLKIGAFTIGGGYAMVPLIENEVVTKRGWMKPEEFVDLLAIAQSAPGVLAINVAIFVGYKLLGLRGACIATLGTALPSFTIILTIAIFFQNFKDNATVARIFQGIRPAVVALIAVPTFTLAKSVKLNRYTWWIPVVAAILIWQCSFSPIWVIVLAGIGGLVWGRITASKPS